MVHRASITYETNAAVMLTRLQLLCFCLLWTAVKACLTLTIAVFAFSPVFGIKRVRKENRFSFARAACSWAALSERAATQLKTTDDTDLVNNRKKHEALTVRLQFTERTSECVCHTKHGALTDT